MVVYLKIVTSQVKCYKRKRSNQYLVTLKKGHEFKPDEDVYIVGKDDFEKIQEDNKFTQKYYQELEALKNDYRIKDYEKLKEETEKRVIAENKLRNKHDHLQERLRVALEEINQQQKVISDLSNRSFFDYMRGRLPESYKQLSEPKK